MASVDVLALPSYPANQLALPRMMGHVFSAFEALEATGRFQVGAAVRTPFTCSPTTSEDFGSRPVPRSGPARVTLLHRLQLALIQVLDDRLGSWTVGRLVPGLASLPSNAELAGEAPNRLVALAHANGCDTWEPLSACTITEIRRWRGAGQHTTAQLVIAAAEATMRHVSQDRERPPAPRSAVSASLDALLDDLPDARGRFAFELDELRIDSGHTASERPSSHQFLGLSSERVRQLKVVARDLLVGAAQRDGAVDRCTRSLSARLGAATDQVGLTIALEVLGLPPTSDPAGLLAVWLAGPYRAVPGHDGWWSSRPSVLVDETRALLSAGGGVHAAAVLIRDLAHIGVTDDHADRWLVHQRVRIDDGVVVDLRGRPRDVAARALDATGRAMSLRELGGWMPTNAAASALAGEMIRSALFIETAPDRWELADWGGEPSAHSVRIGVLVTPEAIGGADSDLSSEFASLLRMSPGSTLTVRTRFGPLVVTYDGGQLSRGSVRPVVLASGAAVGDVLWFDIDPRESAAQVIVESTASTNQATIIQSTSTARSTQ